ncbi:MAG TPA: hypothetical protein VGC20_15235 [bacterium]|jgi:hypothetical protein
MKRKLLPALLAALALLVAGCVAGPPAWADAPYGPPSWAPASGPPNWAPAYGPPGWAPVPSWGGTPWGGGYPGWGAGSGFGLYGQIPRDKQARLRELGVETQRKVIGLQADYEEQVAAYLHAVDTYPLDAAAATKAWDAMQGLSRQMFQLRLEAMTKAQQIMGKELWDQLREGRGFYFGTPPRR